MVQGLGHFPTRSLLEIPRIARPEEGRKTNHPPRDACHTRLENTKLAAVSGKKDSIIKFVCV